MKKIYLIRHGESIWNAERRLQGQQNIPLTTKGISQAHLIGNRLVKEKIDRIYTSDLDRAYITAKIISDKVNAEIIPMKEFRELNFGIWEGLSYDEICQRYSDDFILWKKKPDQLHITGSETLYDLRTRVINGVKTICNESGVENIAIISHGIALKAMILGLLDIDFNYFKNFTIDNVSLSIIEFREHNKVLKLFNDLCHIN